LINPGQRAAIRARIEITGAAAHGAQFGRLITVGPFGFGAGSDTVGFSFKRQ
jgi:hypothetical protein